VREAPEAKSEMHHRRIAHVPAQSERQDAADR
jgi:hypothetical protein